MNTIGTINNFDMKRLLLILVVGLIGIFVTEAKAQKKSIMITGVVMDADSIVAIPYVNILLKDTFFGTVSDNTGHFTFKASVGDTLEFSFVGYFDAYFVMPKNLAGESYSLIQLMRKETILLDEVVIFPWPAYDQLKKAFLSAKPKPGINEKEMASIREIRRVSQSEYEQNKFYYNVYHNNQLYDMTGIVPANNFLNPIQWSNFIQDVANKKYKNEKK